MKTNVITLAIAAYESAQAEKARRDQEREEVKRRAEEQRRQQLIKCFVEQSPIGHVVPEADWELIEDVEDHPGPMSRNRIHVMSSGVKFRWTVGDKFFQAGLSWAKLETFATIEEFGQWCAERKQDGEL